MTDDSPREKQDNEIEALKAIFGDDLKDQRNPDNWQTWEPLNILLSLFPHQGSMGNQGVHCTVVLHIICSPQYPDIEPKILIDKSKGLSDVRLNTLLKELDALATDLKGEVMIFELAQHVQTFLHHHNKPGFKSFYEEMMIAQKQKEQTRLKDMQVKEDMERQELNNEILRCQEILKLEMKLSKEFRNDIFQDLPNEITNALPSNIAGSNIDKRLLAVRKARQSVSESSEGSVCNHRGVKILNFKGEKEISRGRCLGHSEHGNIKYIALDNATGELFVLIEWIFPTRPQKYSPQKTVKNKNTTISSNDAATLLKNIVSIENELFFLNKLHHPNLVQYLNFNYVQENDCVTINILQDFVYGANMSSLYIFDHIKMEIDKLRHFALGVLDVLNFLHSNNVIHKDLKDSNIFIDKDSNVRIADFSLNKKLEDLYYGRDLNTRYTKKYDILRFGMLIISLLKGERVVDDSVNVPAELPQELKHFLNRCIDKNEKSRWSVEQLLDHQFIKSALIRALPGGDVEQKSDAESVSGPGDTPSNIDIESFIPNGVNGQSRIKNEFEILKWLGKGAFGDVLKVKNKLDGGCYAIKRIELNPKNKQLNKKITREVKLLSRLNHENVVRYYNSWIESAVLEEKDYDNSLESNVTSENMKKSKVSFSFLNDEDVEKLAPAVPSVEWSVSYNSRSKPREEKEDMDSSESDDDDDDNDDDMNDWRNFLSNINTSSNSDSIEFKTDDSTAKIEDDFIDVMKNEKKNGHHRDGRHDSVVSNFGCTIQVQFLYIQMEFCEKSTLRNAIDNDLYSNHDRVWRLFREIVEGLSHIHQQGMIHRDLKPVNIFLDSNDHVKIGDFGLATNILPKSLQPNVDVVNNEVESYSHDVGDGTLTGQVGTALYVAPELTITVSKAIYNQKVDIYSLGIILFEMSYMPLKTGMERVKILGNLRQKDIIMPENFLIPENSKQIQLIKWLLNHDGSCRPMCMELLQSDLLPSALEEYELQEVLRHALSDKKSKGYRNLINSCFQQQFNPTENITYYMNSIKMPNTFFKHNVFIMNTVKETVIKIFKIHGGLELRTPLLLPSCHLYDTVESSVRLMTSSGNIVHIPHDLRVPFARYVAWNSITSMKRFSIERVYREKKFFGFHPTELYECSFDIVTSTAGNYLADAEILCIVYEIVNEFHSLKSKSLAIHLNHTNLLKAVLMSCDIEKDKFGEIYAILSDKKLSYSQIQTRLISLCLSDQAMVTLFNLMETECFIDKLAPMFRFMTKKKGEASVLAKEAMKDLETIIHHAEAFGIKCPIMISPCMVYNIDQYSGMMCQFICELKKKRRKGDLDVIAAGGRYDNMILNFRKSFYGQNDVLAQAAVGISLSLDHLVRGAIVGNEDDTSNFAYDVYVCANSSSKVATKEKAQVTSLLWNAGIKTCLTEASNNDEILDICKLFVKAHIVIVGDSDRGTVNVRSWDHDKFQVRKVSISRELVEFLQRLLMEDSGSIPNLSLCTQVVKSDSRNFNEYEKTASTLMPAITVDFISAEKSEKLTASARRRSENQIQSQMSSFLQQLTPKSIVRVLAVSLEISIIRTIISYLDIDAPQTGFDKAIRNIIEKHPRHKKYLIEICDEIIDMGTSKAKPIIALYSLKDSMFKIIM